MTVKELYDDVVIHQDFRCENTDIIAEDKDGQRYRLVGIRVTSSLEVILDVERE